MIKLNWICFCNQSGYGQAAQNYINALLKHSEFDIRVQVIANQIVKPAISDKRFELLMHLSKKDDSPDRIQIYHCIPIMHSKFKRKEKNISFATFETYDPPETGPMAWIPILDKTDAVVVPSQFNYQVFAHTSLKKPIFYVPHCLDMQLYHPDVKPMKDYNQFTFLFMGAWKIRKGYPQLLEAWFSEFSMKDNVQLVIKTDQVKIAKVQVEQLRKNLGYRNKEIAPVLFEDKVFNDDELPRFMKSSQCLVAPHCGEGFGLPGLQCMSLGIPIIITDFSGSQDYANEETATLLKPRGMMMHDCMDKYPQFKNKRFAFIAVEDVKKQMRYVLENYDKAQEKVKVGAKLAAENFNYQKISGMFRDMIGTLYNV
tara:strand:- start:1532 stop:2641 length:1110 start_codon:yes stop_codon:yes gene_type:complete